MDRPVPEADSEVESYWNNEFVLPFFLVEKETCVSDIASLFDIGKRICVSIWYAHTAKQGCMMSKIRSRWYEWISMLVDC